AAAACLPLSTNADIGVPLVGLVVALGTPPLGRVFGESLEDALCRRLDIDGRKNEPRTHVRYRARFFRHFAFSLDSTCSANASRLDFQKLTYRWMKAPASAKAVRLSLQTRRWASFSRVMRSACSSTFRCREIVGSDRLKGSARSLTLALER